MIILSMFTFNSLGQLFLGCSSMEEGPPGDGGVKLGQLMNLREHPAGSGLNVDEKSGRLFKLARFLSDIEKFHKSHRDGTKGLKEKYVKKKKKTAVKLPKLTTRGIFEDAVLSRCVVKESPSSPNHIARLNGDIKALAREGSDTDDIIMMGRTTAVTRAERDHGVDSNEPELNNEATSELKVMSPANSQQLFRKLPTPAEQVQGELSDSGLQIHNQPTKSGDDSHLSISQSSHHLTFFQEESPVGWKYPSSLYYNINEPTGLREDPAVDVPSMRESKGKQSSKLNKSINDLFEVGDCKQHFLGGITSGISENGLSSVPFQSTDYFNINQYSLPVANPSGVNMKQPLMEKPEVSVPLSEIQMPEYFEQRFSLVPTYRNLKETQPQRSKWDMNSAVTRAPLELGFWSHFYDPEKDSDLLYRNAYRVNERRLSPHKY